jgi:ARG and Rhodanese-Phosphatase-superfamily-associated Protein domain
MTLDAFQLGEPVEHRGIVVTPLFPRRDPVAAYITLDEALPRGLRITETSDSGSVPELFVENPADTSVLLYDGEELVGAKQNRILNVSVLVGAGAKLPIPVSCVEQGRWSRQSDAFGSAKHISHSHLRRRKAETLAAQPLALGLAQGDVWDEVRDKQERMGVHSRTAANRDTFEAHAARLEALESAFVLTHGQCGAVLGIGDDLCLDAVSRPDAFALLWPELRAGYLLDALERLDGRATSVERISAFAESVGEASATRGASAGLGEDVRLRGAGVIGSGLELEGETIQLSAFTSDDGGARAFGRIARPSRRR